MVGPRWRKVARDLAGHRFRTLLVVLSIAVGIFAIGVVMGAREVLIREFDGDFATSNPANATFFTSPFDDRLVREVAERTEVADAEGRAVVAVRYRARPSQPWQTIRLSAVGNVERMSVERVTPEDGAAWPPASGEVLLERSARSEGTFATGQMLEVQTAAGKDVRLRIAGFAHDINAVPVRFMGIYSGFMSMNTLKLLEQSEGYNQLSMTFEGEGLTRVSASRMAADIRDEVLEPSGLQVFSTSVPKPGSHFLGDIFKAVSLLLLALGLMSLVLSGFLVVNTISALMAQHVRQVGIMKSVGGRASQIGWMYIAMVGVFGALAVLVGLPAANAGGRWFTGFAADLLNFRVTSYVPPPWVLWLEVAVGLAVPVLAAAVPVASGVRMPVARALNSTGIASTHFGHGLTDRLLGTIRGLPRPVALSLRNTFLRKGRLALTLVTLSLASMVVMAVVSVKTSLDQTVADLNGWWRYDAQFVFNEPADAEAVEHLASRGQGVIGVETWIGQSASLERADGSENENLYAIGLPPRTDFVRPRLVSGRWLRPGDEDVVVVNTDVVKDEPGLAAGDMLRLKMRGDTRQWEIVGIVSGQLMGPVVYADRGYLDSVVGNAGGVSRLLVRTADHGADAQARAAAVLEQRLKEGGYDVARAETSSSMAERLKSEFGVLVTFLVVMAALLALVGAIGLTGTMTINVIESTREIGVMRSIGASHGSVFQIFVAEGVTVGAIAWAAGAAAAYPASVGLLRLLEGAMNIPLSFRFSWAGVALWFAIVTAIAVTASLLPAYRASQVSVRDAIAYE